MLFILPVRYPGFLIFFNTTRLFACCCAGIIEREESAQMKKYAISAVY